MIVLKLNVIGIQKELGAHLDFEVELILEDITWQGEPIGFKGPLLIEGKVSEQDPEYFIYQGNEADLSDIVLEHLIYEIPSRRRCREDCKGLCQDCGTNLNVQTCQCTRADEEKAPNPELDERLKTLKD